MSVDWKKIFENISAGAQNVKIILDNGLDKLKGVAQDLYDKNPNNPTPSPYETGTVKDLTYTPYGETDAGIKDKEAWDKAIETYNQNVSPFSYANDEAYKAALEALTGREKFTYDLNSDALYQQFAEQYRNMGKLASEDVMGQAAMLTGGYGNSYAATAGNQAYQSYLNQLNNIVPELYNSALNAYNAEGQRLADNVNMYMQDYSKAYTDWANNESYYKGLVDDAEATYHNNANAYMTEADILNAATSANNENAWKDYTVKETNRQQANAEKDQAAQDAYKAYVDTLDIYSTFDEETLKQNQIKNGGSYYDSTVKGLDEIANNNDDPIEYVEAVIGYLDDMYNKSYISPEEKKKIIRNFDKGSNGNDLYKNLAMKAYNATGGDPTQAKAYRLQGLKRLYETGLISESDYNKWLSR